MPKRFAKYFENEFRVDEPREEVVDVQVGPREMRVWDAEPSREAETAGGKNLDLVSEVSLLMREHDRLQRLAEELKIQSGGSSKEDLKRFFRASVTIFDSFDRIAQMAESLPPSEEVFNWLKSVAGIQSRMISLYERHGLRAMDPIGQPVDLDCHEVVEVVHTESVPDETVVEVRQKGYTFDGNILRDARVVVAKNERT
jgi:molecular chaperone GrpE